MTEQPIYLERIDRQRNMARYYALSIEPSLFGDPILVRRWGRIGGASQQKLQFCVGNSDAELLLRRLLAAKRRRGYREPAI
ncbi:WGR domain-containing protein [Rhizobium halophytocola]|uniref:DNA-binding WGR domain protein n=1 Tax=Rhizobium halophytocola TaxID=735519 RepID=A0ABS4DUL2_9HYPH|nr:WGR domain-containing protein [Rhizobium halophytocola]MBP1849381.1 putative DNA-binding WGR domain protein [Rhizobium halophytocola]